MYKHTILEIMKHKGANSSWKQ